MKWINKRSCKKSKKSNKRRLSIKGIWKKKKRDKMRKILRFKDNKNLIENYRLKEPKRKKGNNLKRKKERKKKKIKNCKNWKIVFSNAWRTIFQNKKYMMLAKIFRLMILTSLFKNWLISILLLKYNCPCSKITNRKKI